MQHEITLTKANRLKLAQAFKNCQRVDFSIECVIEGQMGKAFADDPTGPTAYSINIGPFWYFAGDAHGPGGSSMMSSFPAYNLLMPSTDGWLETAKQTFGQNLVSFTRYCFSSANLNSAHLENLLNLSPHRAALAPISVELAGILANQPEPYFELSDFDSADDFIERSIGFVAMDREKIMGVAYGSLVCSQGIEVSIYVEETYRRNGVATALASMLLLQALQRGLRPNWDAANLESCRLAERLGYKATGSYETFYHTRKTNPSPG